MNVPLQLGLRCGCILGMIGLFHVAFSTLTPMPRTTWGLMQNFYGVITVFFAGWAGLKTFAATRRIGLAAIAGALTGVLGVSLFTLALFTLAYGFTDRLAQFPFAAEDLNAPGKSVAEYLHSAKGFKDLWTSSLGSLLAMAPLAAGFGAVGSLVARSVDDIKEPAA